MIARLCEPEHVLIIILVLLVSMLAFGSGKGIGTIMGGLIRKLTGKGDVIVNVGEDQGAAYDGGIDRRLSGLTLADLRQALSELKPLHCADHMIVKERQDGVLVKIEFLVDECKSIWGEIKDINKRQISLREKLPTQYVSRDDLSGIKDRLKSIDDKLDRYMESSIKK